VLRRAISSFSNMAALPAPCIPRACEWRLCTVQLLEQGRFSLVNVMNPEPTTEGLAAGWRGIWIVIDRIEVSALNGHQSSRMKALSWPLHSLDCNPVDSGKTDRILMKFYHECNFGQGIEVLIKFRKSFGSGVSVGYVTISHPGQLSLVIPPWV